MVQPENTIVKRLQSLTSHLEQENPLLVDAIDGFKKLDSIGYKTGMIRRDDSYAMQISWWPLVSVLGVFSAGKSSFINSYLGANLQKTGNQAVDDKFTVVCFGEENDGRVLPGLALDADMRFPFYRVSDEIERVAVGEGRRIDAYLQLKVANSEKLRGKILIDSPGFDADDQRSSTLKLTDHIMNISDLVLVFFDARHPEPGAMQDTLTHLVESTINRADSTKFLFILNQIDTAAREDNAEEIVAAWQRALSQKGLTAGRFYTIYNEDAALPIEDAATKARFESKRNADMAEIDQRIQQVETERAYRIVGAMEKQAYNLRDEALPALTHLKKTWASRVLRFDAIVAATLVVIVLGVALATGTLAAMFTFILSLFADPISMLAVIVVLGAFAAGVHFFIRSRVARYMLKKMAKSDEAIYSEAFKKNTRFFRSVFSSKPVGWNKRSVKTANEVIEFASEFVQKLNDQFANPSGIKGG